MPLNQKYIDAIKGFEGYSDTPSWDYKQYTSGFGTRAQSPNERIDRATAEQRLRDELTNAAGHVDKAYPGLAEGPRAALTSLTFNAGPGWINSGLGKAVGEGNFDEARKHFLQYNKAGGSVSDGLANRRAAEAAWFAGDGGDSPMASAFTSEEKRNMTPIEAALAQARTKLQGFTPQPGEDPGILSSLAQQYAPAAAPYVPSADTFDKASMAFSMLRDNPGATAAAVAAYNAKNKDSDVQNIAHGDNLIQISKRTGKVLGMTPLPRTRTEPKIINVPDGSGVPGATIPKLVNPDGSLSTPEGAPETANRLTPGEKKDDETFAKEHAAWLSGGAEGTKTSIDKLRGIAKELRDSEKKSSIFATKGNGADTIGDVLGPTGPLSNLVPDSVNAFINPKAKELKNRAWDAFQTGARGVLGSQYTEKEGRAFFDSNYDPSLSPSVNATNLERKAAAMEKAATAKQSASEYFQQNKGSLRGYNYAAPSLDTFNEDTTPAAAAPTSGGYKVIKVH